MKDFKINKDDIKKLTNNAGACIVSNRILIDGEKVGYMYREQPTESYNDSGWRIFAGDETDDYCNNPENFNIVELNTVCNYDESIIAKLDAEIGASYKRYKCGRLVKACRKKPKVNC